MTCAPAHRCSFCHGSGRLTDRDCHWCDGVGSIFTTIILRGHPLFDGRSEVIEGVPTVHLIVRHEGSDYVFERATESRPPHWFILENGVQVYRFIGSTSNRPAPIISVYP